MIGAFQRRRGAGAGGPPPATSRPLDGKAPPLLALSLGRSLFAASDEEYACTVQRDNDSGSLNIGFVDGLLDVATLAEYAGSHGVEVAGIYDQGPAGRHFTQADPARRPLIVSAGNLQLVNGSPAARFANNAWLRYVGSFSGLTRLRQAWVVEIDPLSRFAFGRLCSWTRQLGSDFSDFGFMVAYHWYFGQLYGWQSGQSSAYTVAPGRMIVTLDNSPTGIRVGNQNGSGPLALASYPGFNLWTEVTLGQRAMTLSPDDAFSGLIAEWVAWDQSVSDDEWAAYLADAADFWGV